MKWYSRTMIFTDEFEGQKFLGVEATATISPNNEEAAYLSCMYRNIKLVDANGEVKWEFDCDRYYYDGAAGTAATSSRTATARSSRASRNSRSRPITLTAAAS